jgi:hypothetical protein
LQESGLLNRPEIPHLAGLNRPLLVKAYDLGLIDAKGRTETRVIAEMLAAAEAQVHTCSAFSCSLCEGRAGQLEGRTQYKLPLLTSRQAAVVCTSLAGHVNAACTSSES